MALLQIHPGAVVFAILAAMSIQGSANLQTQWNTVGEFSNLPQEELIEWIKYSTKPDAVFAGAMPRMASVKLSALRPIVNHPHYEDAGLRARMKIVYSMYSRKAAEEVKRELIKLKVNYYILEESWCVRRSKVGRALFYPHKKGYEGKFRKYGNKLCTLSKIADIELTSGHLNEHSD
ncbi:probable C-mannosyltransferase DPY19L1 [Piliocolobus tephrosceles]|uniref:probable C-mannosyltransferase DPY19L1 n=1 Tax=Piliocolobus tephrosceles TaxID=591936 RepID=UPI00130116A5|nr:probable C-mannosyltransferase DPY19L1 [Piliocolobus tephrosceles]